MSDQPQAADFPLPSAFPRGLFEAVKDRFIAKIRATPEQQNIAGGQLGVLYRLRSTVEYSEELIECVRRAGDSPSTEARYQQERQLFGFFVSGIAALDCFSFFIYFAAAYLQPERFPTRKPGDIKAITLKRTSDNFGNAFPGEPITTALANLVNDQWFKDWDELRNILAHRAVLGRIVYASFGTSSPPNMPSEWKIDANRTLKIDEDVTTTRLNWLVITLAGLISAADEFATKYF